MKPKRSHTIVLCYHAVSPSWPAPLSVTPNALRRQLESLLDRGYRGVTFSDAVGESIDERLVAITFDDGFRSVGEQALPILSEFGLTATLFVPTAFIGSDQPMRWPGIDRWLGTRYESELVPLDWHEVEALAAAGWEIGSHSHTHPRLTTLDEGALADELTRSRAVVEAQLGMACRSIAYPYGDHDDRVVRGAGSAGYRAACTLPHRLHPAARLRWPRVGIYNDDSAIEFRLKTSRLVQSLRATRR